MHQRSSISIFIFLLQVHLVIAQTISTKNVAMYRGNSQLTGVLNEKPIYKLKGVQFTFQAQGAIRCMPVIANNTLFFGSADGNCYAIDSKNGKLKWKFPTGGAIHSSPAIAGNTVYIASRDEKIYGLDINTGKKIWEMKTGNENMYENNGWDYYLSSPCIDNNTLYIGSGDGFVYAVNLNDKNIRWKYNVGSHIRTTPSLINDMLLIADMRGFLYAIDKRNGSLIWKFATRGSNYKFSEKGFDAIGILSSPTIANGSVLLGARDGFFYCIDLRSGKEKWKFDHDGSWVLSSSFFSNTAYAGSGTAAFVQAIDLNTGKEKWRFNTGSAVFSSLIHTGDLMYFDDVNGNLYAVNSDSGKLQWKFPMGKRSFASPLVHDGMIYCGSDDGIMYALAGTNEPSTQSLDPIKKVVYWEPVNDTCWKWFQNGTDIWIKNYFANSGYTVMNAAQLADFMNNQIKDRTLSVVVFAQNQLPKSIATPRSENALVRKYIDAGGRIVFLGPNPSAYYINQITGKRDSANFLIGPRKMFGLEYDDPGYINNSSAYNIQTTKKGETWGLRGWWIGYSAIPIDQATTVLALNEYGKAAAWFKQFGNNKNSGILQLAIPNDICVDLAPIKATVEYQVDW